MDIFHSKIIFVSLQHLCQAALSGYGGYLSYIAITNLQQYEATTKKMAQWSAEVQRQLKLTRTTQASGAGAVFLSLVASLGLAFFGDKLDTMYRLSVAPVMLGVVMLARGYIKGFWTPTKDPNTGKPVTTKLPLPRLAEYNLAAEKTEELVEILRWLEYSWVWATFVVGMVGTGMAGQKPVQS